MIKPKSTNTIKNINQLLGADLINSDEAANIKMVIDKYSLAIPIEIQNLIKNKNDALYKQFVPDKRELNAEAYELEDPIGDEAHSPIKGIVHRYTNRVLLKPLSVCPVYCRFCFRRENIGHNSDGALSPKALENAIAYIANNPQIDEVILTGGDPMSLSPRRLSEISIALAKIPHIQTMRLHSRVPIATPNTINDQLIAAIKQSEKTNIIAAHINHPDELSINACAAIKKLQENGIIILSQTVLLKDVNDDANILAQLMRAFIKNNIMPYYLHHPDLARGTNHFQISIAQGRKIYSELSKMVANYALPKYVLDIPGGFGKVPINDEHFSQNPDGTWQIKDRNNKIHFYNGIN